MVNGSSSGTPQRRASSGSPGAGDTGRPGALPRRPEQQRMPHCSAASQKNGEARQASPTHVRYDGSSDEEVRQAAGIDVASRQQAATQNGDSKHR